jgi:ubiquinone/menaquinone biosynthesis C-methylase UbiE
MRTTYQIIIDFIFFPLRALTLFENDRWGLSSLRTERYDYVSSEVRGKCLDVGCGRNNRFIKEFVKQNGVGVDVYKYEGLSKVNIIKDPTKLPFKNDEFGTVTLIANINHIPMSIRKDELKDIYRVLKKNGRIVVTMGNPLAEILVHRLVWFYDRFLKTKVDVDSQRGMEDGEEFFLTDEYIIKILSEIGFRNIIKKYFGTQWGLNHLFVGEK